MERPITDLPIEDIAAELVDALRREPNAVVVAPPGSGKTTVVPLMLLGEPWVSGRKIVVLEPRRLATRAAAARIAHLLGSVVGERVGYVTRDDRKTGPGVEIEVVTEGVLTRRLQRDPELPDTAAVLFDELHERNLQTDLGLALALDAQSALRPDLRIIAMSATIDAERVASLLGGDEPAPVVSAEGRLHPVDILWRPADRRARRIEPHVASTVRWVLDREPGDVLVFLPGIGEINRVARELEGVGADIHRLHGSLPLAEQDAAVTPQIGRRRVVLSTDIAETSLTVEGVRVVVDSGRARAPRFDPRTGMTRLQTISISKASAEQRAGRAGRLEPGIGIRLWSKMEHAGRSAHIEPEISQVDLASLMLELAAWGTRDPATLRFLDRPPRRAMEEARRLLTLLGAIDQEGALTETGRRMVRLPLHPRLGRMVVDAGTEAPLAVVLAALLEDRDIFSGHPDEVPVDLAVRVAALDRGHSLADRRGVDRVRRRVRDLNRRAGITGSIGGVDGAGAVLAMAFPDRLAVRRGGPGRFQLRTGTSAWLNQTDPLAVEQYIVPADLDGKRKDARIRVAAAIDAEQVAVAFAHEVDEKTELVWRDRRLVECHTRRLGGLTLDESERRPRPGPEVVEAILTRVRKDGIGVLEMPPAAVDLRARVGHLRRTVGDPWPDWSDGALVAGLDEWLAPFLSRARGLGDVDLVSVLRAQLVHPLSRDLDRLAPRRVVVPSGRQVEVDYSGDQPRISVAVQEMFGSTATPKIGGAPLTLELLSPARRPVQVTSDLGGFWAGSWKDVRKEMAGRYPKHEWPEDPATARPVRK